VTPTAPPDRFDRLTAAPTAIGLEDVRRAAARLDGVAHRTPVLRSRTLDERVGAELFLKAEMFQRIGAFKFRGAFNAISSLDDSVRARGVCAVSSGRACPQAGRDGRLRRRGGGVRPLRR
jgi:threonine dehydratase